jgi:malonyl CoA-acyl carrier protein transacylase
VTTVVMFPGQGVQRVGMGHELFDDFADLEAAASDMLGYSMRRLCLEDPHHQLNDTRYTQSAVYVVNALAYRRWRATAPEPDLALGHSLGEYNALEAAGAIGFLDGLRLVHSRARITSQIRGGMTAVLGLLEGKVRRVLTSGHHDDVEIANINAPTQFVLAGPDASLGPAEAALTAAGAFDIRRLAVGGPFHSSHMATVAAEFAAVAAGTSIKPATFPVIANRTARPHRVDRIARTLVEHVHHPVLWHESLMWIIEQDPLAEFVEIGDAGILTRMVRRLRPRPHPSPFLMIGKASMT